ncbi:membrane protein insertion efficiency factor YidD [bacterium]|nr:membrane protein insertion efficiency factor YidD [bacterium]
MSRWVIALIRIYQGSISRMLGPRCRFYPSCSEYAVTAIQRFGIFEGSYRSLRRLIKCHPFHPGGLDPVGEK